MLEQTERQLILEILNNGCSEEMREKILATFPDYMPYKGVGFVTVDNVEEAEEILKTYISEDMYKDDYLNCPEGRFLKANANGHICYGRLMIDNPKKFMIELLENGIAVLDYAFDQYTDHYPDY